LPYRSSSKLKHVFVWAFFMFLLKKTFSRNNTAIIIGLIIAFMFFSLNLGTISIVFGYAGDSTTTTSTVSTACTASKPGSAPSLLFAAPGNNSVTLTWSKATNPVTKYLIAYGATSEAMQYGNPSVGGAGTTFYTVGSLSGGTRYYFKVKAINDCMPGDFSNVLSAVSTGAVTTTTGPAEGFAPVSEIPGNLFDIALTIDSAVLGKSSELVARTQFTSFGTVPTLVNMVYRIEDASGKEVFSENGEVTVETEKTVTKEFKSLALGSGKYTLVLSTTYGNNVQDEFKQAFEVKGLSVAKRKTAAIWIISIMTVVGGYIIFLFIKRKRKKKMGS